MMNTEPSIRRITGPACNFITAMTRRVWAFNEHNHNHFLDIEEGDILVLHQTGNDYLLGRRISSVIGFAIAGSSKGVKTEPWWADEVASGEVTWPYWIQLKAVYVFGDPSNIDLDLQVHEKKIDDLRTEADLISQHAVPMSAIQESAANKAYRNFPVNGSTSKIDERLLPLILGLAAHPPTEAFEDQAEAFTKIAKEANNSINGMTKEEALKELKEYMRDGNKKHHKKAKRTVKERIEDERQKLLVAYIEDHRCQVCGFSQEYINSSGKICHIIDIDHIKEKKNKGGEEGGNLWALCPNCHRKKGAGIIKIDLENKRVTENGTEIKILDNHLFK